jgi:hypothetical protein
MPKCLPVENSQFFYMIFCPACNCGHGLTKSWTFNGDFEKPTFSPSLLVKGVEYPEEDPTTGDFLRGPDGKYLLDASGRILGAKDTVCHSFIKDGMISYCGDSTHPLAGLTVELPNM